ncbi:hypothetical protein C8R46DRAFT_1353334 [Mycena filopes]|nr:hypothetical protein C8R46DRAFT_1353334 [Mycena filopes]
MALATQCKNCGQLAATDSGTPILPAHPSNADRRLALANIKSQIAVYKKYIAALEEQADELEENLALVIYPVLTLPTEITSAIFVHCLPPHGRVEPSTSRAPLLLTRICHDWREIALETCALWTSVYISPALDIEGLLSQAVRLGRDNRTSGLLQTWLARAKASPLSLGLDFQIRAISEHLLDIALSFAGQIQQFDLRLTASGPAVWALNLLTLPALHELTIPRFSDTDEVPEFVARSCCIIEHLTISFEEHEEGEEDPVGRWLPIFPHVTVLDVKECPDVDDLLDWLEPGELMPHLEALTFDCHLTPSTFGQNHDEALISLLHSRRDLPECTKLRKLHMRFTLAGGDDDEMWVPGNLAKRELERLIDDGLDFLFHVASTHSGTLTWPKTYVAPEPVPFVP